MHGIHKAESFADAAFLEAGFDFISDIDESDAFGGLEPEFLAIAFHGLAGFRG